MSVRSKIDSTLRKSASAPIRVPVRITNYTDSSIAAKMCDTAYLKMLSGDYTFKTLGGSSKFVNISDDPHRYQPWNIPIEGVVTVQVRENKTLWLVLPSMGEYELVAIIPILFELKGLPKANVLYLTDPEERVFALSLQYDKKELISAKKKEYRYDE